jgi:PadR family transcriptional regulator AphA
MSRTNKSRQRLLLGEWACLGILYPAPSHGFAVAAQLKPDGDIGRVWSMSRALTYRCLDQLIAKGYVRSIGEEPGIAGGNRTLLQPTRRGRAALREWLALPVVHLRDLRSELLLKLILADRCAIDVTAMLDLQRAHIVLLVAALSDQSDGREPTDVVALWRAEASQAALRFLDALATSRSTKVEATSSPR